MPLSPRTNAFMQVPATQEDEKATFEQGFARMASSIFTNKYPDLAQNVITFKIINSDIDTGSGVGAFVLDINGDQLFAPVVLANNNIKPIEILYFKDRNVFVPLKREWLDEIGRHADEALGEAVKEPKNLQRDVDIRNLVIPPTTGRYAYASAEATPGAKGGIDGSGKSLIDCLSHAPNYVKKAYVKVLNRNHRILKFAAEHFNFEALANALRPLAPLVDDVALMSNRISNKINGRADSEKRGQDLSPVEFLTVENSVEDFRRVFGKNAAEAFELAAKLGYVMKDSRPQQKLVVETEKSIRLFETKESGFYTLYMKDGSPVNALVISAPQSFQPAGRFDKRVDIATIPDPYKRLHRKQEANLVHGIEPDYSSGSSVCETEPHFLVILDDGRCEELDHAPIGKKLYDEGDIPDGGKIKNVIDAVGDNIVAGDHYVFVGFHGNRLMATKPFRAETVSTDAKGVRRIKTYGRTLVTDPESSIHAIVSPRDGNIAYVPTNFIPIRVDMAMDIPLVTSPDMTICHVQHLEKQGAERVRILADDGVDLFCLNGKDSQSKLGCLRELVVRYNISPADAESVMEKAAAVGKYSFCVATPEQLKKYAEGMQIDPATGQPMEMPPQAQDAQAAAMTPEMEQQMAAEQAAMAGQPQMSPAEVAPPAPPAPPSPVDLAVADVGAAYAQQAAATAQQLADEQKALADRMTVLQEVQQRANEISSGQTQGPPQIMTSGMEETMLPEQEDAAAAQLAGQMEGPMEQSAMMGQGLPSDITDSLATPEMFEATAIGSMAANPDLRGIVSSYVPNLEEALDNLARILLTLWMQEREFSEALGEVEYNDLEERLRLVFNNLGSLILKINQTAMAAGEGNELS